MTSPAEGFMAILTAEGTVEGGTGWKCNVGELPDIAPVVTIIDHAGRGGEVKVAIDYPAIQILVMGTILEGGYSDTYAKADEIFATLQGIDTPHASFPRLVSCVAMGLPQWLGRDQKRRPRFSLNFRLITTPEDEGNRNY